MIYAVDFDGTLTLGGGAANIPLIRFLKQRQAAGDIVILNTCRAGARLREAVTFCARYGLRFNAVNENVPLSIQALGYNPRKIFADVYIDDKAMRG